MNKFILMASVSVCGMLSAGAGLAQDAGDFQKLMELVRQQSAEIQSLKSRLEILEKTGNPEKQITDNTPPSSPVPTPASGSGVVVDWKGAPEIRSADDEWSFKVIGRLQTDAATYRSDNNARDFNDGINFRRARVGVQGSMPSDFKYKIEVNFADGENAKMEDTYLQYTGFSPVTLTVGRHKVYHSLVSATSDTNVSFMERSIMSNAFEAGAGGKLGVSAFTGGDNWTFHLGLMADDANRTGKGEDGWGVNSRATFAPVLEARKVVHLGASAYTRKESEHAVTFGDKPEISVDGTKLLSSGSIPMTSFQYYAVEAATVLGSFSAQAEYGRAHVNTVAQPDMNYSGGYVSATYFLTGESRPYMGNKGYFGRVKPLHPLGSSGDGMGWGAFEVAARYSYVDLADEGLGNKQKNITVGMNWYPNNYTRFMLNFVDFDTDATGPASADDSGQIFGVRAQVDW